MPRSSLFALAALLCAALTLPPAAVAAKTAPQSCTTTSNAVVGGKVVGKLTSSNVDPVQAVFATCKHAKKVMGRATELGVEEMVLLTNTHHTLVGLDGYGLSIVGERPIDLANAGDDA